LRLLWAVSGGKNFLAAVSKMHCIRPIKEAITAYVRPKIAGRVRELAAEEEMTVSNFLERLVERSLKEKEEATTMITRGELSTNLVTPYDVHHLFLESGKKSPIDFPLHFRHAPYRNKMFTGIHLAA
jgi:hypothetical protein